MNTHHSTSITRIVSLLVLPASAAFGQKMPDTRLNVGAPPGMHFAQEPRIATSGISVYVVWWDQRDFLGDIYLNRSLDAGATWLSPDVRLDVGTTPGAASSHSPEIAASGGSVYAAWVDERNGGQDVYFNRSLDRGSTWLPTDVRLDVGSLPGAASSEEPSIAAAESTVFVVWEDERNAGASDIYFNRSLDRGTTWLPDDIRLDHSDDPSFSCCVDPQIAVSGSSVYVVWQEERDGFHDVYFNRSLDAGTTWLPAEIRLDVGTMPGERESAEARIAATGSSVYVTWGESDPLFTFEKTVLFNRSLDRGTSWLSSSVRLDVGTAPGFGRASEPEIAALGAAVYVAWQDGRASRGDIYFNRSLDAGTTWLPADVRLDVGTAAGEASSRQPCIANRGLSVFVGWTDDRNQMVNVTRDLYFNRSLDQGTSWLSTDVRINVGSAPGVGSTRVPQIAAAGSSVYLTWEDGRNGSPDIFFNVASGHQPYGTAKPGAGGVVPTISASGNPAIGGDFTIELENGRGGASGLLLYGFSGAASLPVAGGTLHVGLPILKQSVTLGGSPGAPGAGSTSLSIAVPLDLSLIGLRVNSQAGFFDDAALNGFSLTAGLETWVL